MTAARQPKPPRMTVDAFLDWAERQPGGRYELVDGEVWAMASETVLHVRVKSRAFAALDRAVEASGLPCEALGDGATVRVAPETAYEPDALLRCGPDLPDDGGLEVPDPLLVVEVLSPSSRAVDTGRKFAGYFALPSLRHYLILDPVARTVLHHRRDGEGGPISSALLRDAAEGPSLLLDPPGLLVPVAALFGARRPTAP